MKSPNKQFAVDIVRDPKKRSRKLMRVCSFFAGIGGFDLGFQRASGVPVFHCEINPFCLSVLRRHWPKVPTSEDVRLVKSIDIPEAEIWCGGFPCQDVSVARGWLGREGLSGQNSGLFYPFIRLIQERVPEVVVLENVSGLLNSHGGRDFASIIEKFDSLGYGVAWRVLNTRYFGAPQSRPRVYVCAWHGSPEKAVKVLYEQGATHQPENPRLGFLRESRCKATGAYVPEVAFCLAATSGRHTGTDWSRSYVAYKNEVRRLTPSECERIQGFPTGWALPARGFSLDRGGNGFCAIPCSRKCGFGACRGVDSKTGRIRDAPTVYRFSGISVSDWYNRAFRLLRSRFLVQQSSHTCNFRCFHA